MHHAMQIDAWGTDGEEVQIQMPSGSELSDLVLAGEKQLKSRLGTLSSSTCLCFWFPFNVYDRFALFVSRFAVDLGIRHSCMSRHL